MTDDTTYFIDANIPMYAAGADHPLKSPCAMVLDLVARGQLLGVTDAEVIQEILYRYTSLGQRRRGVELSTLFLEIVPVVLALGRSDIERAVDIHNSFVRLESRDSVHVAAMLEHHVVHVISADKHFDDLPGIERHDPSEWSAKP
jgi:uncharacterized protein